MREPQHKLCDIVDVPVAVDDGVAFVFDLRGKVIASFEIDVINTDAKEIRQANRKRRWWQWCSQQCTRLGKKARVEGDVSDRAMWEVKLNTWCASMRLRERLKPTGGVDIRLRKLHRDTWGDAISGMEMQGRNKARIIDPWNKWIYNTCKNSERRLNGVSNGKCQKHDS